MIDVESRERAVELAAYVSDADAVVGDGDGCDGEFVVVEGRTGRATGLA